MKEFLREKQKYRNKKLLLYRVYSESIPPVKKRKKKAILLWPVMCLFLLLFSCITTPEKDIQTEEDEKTETGNSTTETDSGLSSPDTGNNSTTTGNNKKTRTSSSYKGDSDMGKPPPVIFKTYGNKKSPLENDEIMIFIIFFSLLFFSLYLGIMVRIITRKKQRKIRPRE
jgi:hypothetical protein